MKGDYTTNSPSHYTFLFKRLGESTLRDWLKQSDDPGSSPDIHLDSLYVTSAGGVVQGCLSITGASHDFSAAFE